MPKFRKKQTAVEAVRFDPHQKPWPPGVYPWEQAGYQPRDMSWGYVVTAHGEKASVQSGDWIITEPDGLHHFPLRPNAFAKHYEPVAEQAEAAPSVTDNVIPLGCIPKLGSTIDRVLEAAADVVVAGWDKEGEVFFASSNLDGGKVLWLLEKAKAALLTDTPEVDDTASDAPDEAA